MLVVSACSSVEETTEPVNLLYILTDEMRYDTSEPYGNLQIKTPHLNQLGTEALVFERAYVSQPVCSPARSTILTGLYPHVTGVTTNNIPLSDSLKVLPGYLSEEYVSSYIGKWHLGKELDVRNGFDERISTEDGYTSADTTIFSDYHHWLLDRGYQPDNKKAKIFSRGFCNRLPYEHTKSKYTELKALEFIDNNKDKPFALYLSFLEPHTPNFGPFDDLHDPESIVLDSTYGEYVPKSEPLRHQLIRNHQNKPKDVDFLKREMAKYWGLVHQVDLSVGVLVNRLRELGLYDNTIIVFTSEHGKMMGKFGLDPKRVMYDESARVPLFLKMPQQKEAQKIAYPVSQIDLVPTILDLMGKSDKAGHLHGKSLVPYLDKSYAGNVFIQWHPNSNQDFRYPNCPEPNEEDVCHLAKQQKIRTIVTPNGWKLCQAVDEDDLSQLFALQEDSEEINNLYYRDNHRHVRDSLRLLISDWQFKVRDPHLVQNAF